MGYVSGIDVGEEYNKKWQSPIGTQYNKIIHCYQESRQLDNTKSEPMEEFKPNHGQCKLKTEHVVIEEEKLWFKETSTMACFFYGHQYYPGYKVCI